MRNYEEIYFTHITITSQVSQYHSLPPSLHIFERLFHCETFLLRLGETHVEENWCCQKQKFTFDYVHHPLIS